MKKRVSKKAKKPKQEQHTDDTSPNSTFYASFIGEYVEIICKQTRTLETGIFPVIVSGYLLEIDDKHLYLSDDAQNIARLVKREDYITIEIAKEQTQEDYVLSTVSIPSDREQGN